MKTFKLHSVNMLLNVGVCVCVCESADVDSSDSSSESDLIINHLNQNHYGSDGGSDSDTDQSSGPADHQENHTEDPRDGRHGEEQGNGQAGEPLPGVEGGAEGALVVDHPARYLSAVSLKKRIHTETTKVNNELRALITKEIRKPGRRTWTSSLRIQKPCEFVLTHQLRADRSS